MKTIQSRGEKQGCAMHVSMSMPKQQAKSNGDARLVRTLMASMIAAAIALPSPGYAQTFVAAGPSIETGPNLLMNGADLPQPGQPTDVAPFMGTQSGAIQTIAVNPFNSNIWLVGSPSGGIFRTTDAGQSWTPTTDQKGSLSIGGISYDTTDSSGLTAVAGIALVSSGGLIGLTNQGLLYTTNGGTSWTNIGRDALPAVSILNVTARGQVIMAAAFEESGPNGSDIASDSAAPLSLQRRVNYGLVANSVILETIQPINWTTGTTNPNQWAVGNALNSLQYTAPSAFLVALNDVDTGYVPGNLQVISGQNSVAAFQAVGMAADRFLSTIGHQMMDAPGCLGADHPVSDTPSVQNLACHDLGKELGGHRFWAEAMNVNTGLNGIYGSNRFSGGGLAVGFEVALGEHAKLGGSLGYSNISMQTSAQTQKTRSRQGMAAVYGDYQYGPWYIGGIVSRDMGSNNLDRTFQVGNGSVQNAYAKPNASSTGLRVMSGFNISVANRWYVSPYGTLTRTWNSQNSYTESGASPLALSYASIRQNGYQGELGVNMGKAFQSGKVVMEPYVGLAEVFAWGDRTPYSNVSFVGAPGTSFVIQGNGLPSSWTKAQGGLRLAVNRAVLFDVSYQANLNSTLRNDQFNASVSWRF
jgi:uncharacterized protein with beta-barrel porin domain